MLKRSQRTNGENARSPLFHLLVGLVETAVALYYVGDDRLAAIAAFAHVGAGLLATGVFAWHWVRGRASATRDRKH